MESEIRKQVKQHYGGIAANALKGAKMSCCSSCDCGADMPNSGYEQMDLEGLPQEAVNNSLGCANPLLFAQLKEGETVLDLGSGGGVDVLAASKYVGGSGKVYGLDMTDEMLALANKNKAKMGAANVDFLKGYIEDIPLKDNMVDVIISNCVINLSDDKEKALSEAYRVLKSGGRIAIADIIALKNVSPQLRKQTEMWCGCIAGTLEIDEYTAILQKAGFKNIEIEPVYTYTKDVMEEMFGKKTLGNFKENDINEVDGAFAGAHIKAVK